MASIDRVYMAIALVMLVLAEAHGLYMGIASDKRFLAVHVTMVLIGFVTLALYSCIFRLWPTMKAGMLAAVQFWLGALGTIGLAIGNVLQITTGSVVVLAASSIVVLASAALLLWLFWTRSAEVHLRGT